MWYMGGKIRQGRRIVEHLVRYYDGETSYLELFCGAMGVAEKAVPVLLKLGVRQFVFSDVSKPLITMWRACVFDG